MGSMSLKAKMFKDTLTYEMRGIQPPLRNLSSLVYVKLDHNEEKENVENK
jgi:hypothetical protein